MLHVDLLLSGAHLRRCCGCLKGLRLTSTTLCCKHQAVIDKKAILKLLAEQINRYYQTAGRAYQSVAESSFDAWIKLYRNDENTNNAGISYYNKGASGSLVFGFNTAATHRWSLPSI